jgi:hypothetical protein
MSPAVEQILPAGSKMKTLQRYCTVGGPHGIPLTYLGMTGDSSPSLLLLRLDSTLNNLARYTLVTNEHWGYIYFKEMT